MPANATPSNATASANTYIPPWGSRGAGCMASSSKSNAGGTRPAEIAINQFGPLRIGSSNTRRMKGRRDMPRRLEAARLSHKRTRETSPPPLSLQLVIAWLSDVHVGGAGHDGAW